MIPEKTIRIGNYIIRLKIIKAYDDVRNPSLKRHLENKLDSGICYYGGCHKKTKTDSRYCRFHLELTRKRSRNYERKLRRH